jgi:5-formyltetrahydrofolate cyclo-ligase
MKRDADDDVPSIPAAPDDRSLILAWRRRLLRADLIRQRMELSLEAHRRLSRVILDQILTAFPDLWDGRSIGLYWPFNREISLLPLTRTIIGDGGVVALPVIVAKGKPLQFRAWKPGDPLAAGPWGIPYPRDGHIVHPDVLLVAMVGFDGANFRLGYGGGYYDRTLAAAAPRPMTIGVGFELMRLSTIKPSPYDVPMDTIVTEAGVFPRTSGAAKA